MFYSKILKIFLLILMIYLSGCLENEKPELGRIREKTLPDSKILSYYNSKNIETARISIFDKSELYEIKERKGKNDKFEDTKPINCILVAIDQYRLDPLNCCQSDMEELDFYLRKHFSSYNQEVVIESLYNEDATKQNLEKLFDKQLVQSHLYSTTIFAFSGHGNKDGLELYDKEIPNSKLKHYFKNLKSTRTIWILDCCSSGSLANEKIGTSRKIKSSRQSLFPQESNFSYMHCFLGQGKILICSSLQGQESKDGVFIKSLVYNMSALESSMSLKKIVSNVKESINQYNEKCTSGCKLLMTPFSKLYGDVRIGVIHYPNEY